MLFAFAAFAGLAASPLELVRFPVDSRASFIPVSAFSNELLGWRAVADAAPASRRLAVRGGANCDSNFMQELTGGSGAIELYDVANGYNAYQTCYWRIKPTVPTGSITLFFSDFSLPAGGLHFVQVFSVSVTNELTLLRLEPANLGSSGIPLPVTCSCDQMLVKFRSTYDAGAAFAGLRATYSALEFAVHTIAPLSGPTSGGVTVTVRGVFKGHTGLRCEWTSAVASTFVPSDDITTTVDAASPDTLVRCALAPSLGATAARYDFQLAGTATGASAESIAPLTTGAYHMYPDPVLASLSPQSGRYLDSISITFSLPVSQVVLPPAAADYRCKFGSVVVSGTARGTGGMSCAVPMPLSATATVQLAVALNGVSYSPSTLPFTYADAYCGGAATEQRAAGTISDHERSVAGSPYRPYSACSWLILPPAGLGSCRIALEFKIADLSAGEDAVEIFDGGSASAPLLRRFPDGPNDALARLAPLVSADCRLFVRFRTKVLTGRTGFAAAFSAQPLGLIGVSPALAGTGANGTTTLTLSGQFVDVPLNTTGVACVFTRAGGEEATTPASKASDARVRCDAPVWTRPDAPVQEQVSLSLRVGQLASPSALDFTLVLEPSVASVSPPSGPIGRVVTVRGANFARTAELSCSFGPTVVAATFVSAEEVVCVAPVPARLDREPSPTVSVTVSNNAAYFPPSAASFQFMVYCGAPASSPLEVITSVGTVVDHASVGDTPGSGAVGTYMPLSECFFNIQPSRAASVNLQFDRLSMSAADALVITDAGGRSYDALALQRARGGVAPSFSALPTPVSVRFATSAQPLGNGFALSYADPRFARSACPAGGAAAGRTTFVTSAQNDVFSSTLLDEAWIYHQIVLAPEPTGNKRTLVVTINQLLTTDALASYSMQGGCPSQALFDASATVPANGALSLFTCTGAAQSTVYVGVLGQAGDGSYIPYEFSWQASLIDQLTEVQRDMTLLLADGGALYAKIGEPSDPQLWSAILITVEITTAQYTGAYAGELGVNAAVCGPPGQEQYRVVAAHPDSNRWEISIIEPPATAACARSGYGGVGVEWVVVFQPTPGIDANGASVEADVRLSVDYAAHARAPSTSAASLDTQASIAPGQEHFFSLAGRAIIDVTVSPCAWDAATSAFDCDATLSSAGGLVFEVRAHKADSECFDPAEVSATAVASSGAYRLSACGATNAGPTLRWVIAVSATGVDYAVRYRLKASASDVTAVVAAGGAPIVESSVFPGDARYYRVNVPESHELDITLSIFTEATAPLLTIAATTSGCELASAEFAGSDGVHVVDAYRAASSGAPAQMYRMTLQGCTAAVYFVSVTLAPESVTGIGPFSFTAAFATHTRELPALAPGTMRTAGHAVLPGVLHTFLARLDPALSLTITLTQQVDSNLADEADALDLWALPLEGAGATADELACSSAGAPTGRYEVRVGQTTAAGTAITRTLTVAECAASAVLIGVQSRNARAGAFTEYAVQLISASRALAAGSSAATLLGGALVAGQGNTFQVQSDALDSTIAVRVLVPAAQAGASASAIGLQVDGQQSACAAIANADVVSNGILIDTEWLFASALCAAQATSALATYSLRVTGNRDALADASPLAYGVRVLVEPQVDYAAVLSPAQPLSGTFVLSHGTWLYNYMRVPIRAASETGPYRASFALTVATATSAADGAVTPLVDLSLLQVYLQFGACPSQASGQFQIGRNGLVAIPDTFALVPGGKLYIGLRGNWATSARYAFRARPSFVCDVGFVSSSYSEPCRACEPGTVNPTAGASACTRCSIGEEQPLSGQAACTKCGFGRFQSLPGQPSCELCPAGSEGTRRGARECELCARGLYSEVRGSEACLQCPEGTSTASEGAALATDCECARGFYNPALLPGQACAPCPLGAQCDGGLGLESMPYPTPGYFQEWDESLLLAQTALTDPQQTQYFFLTQEVWPFLELTQQTPRYWGAEFFLPCTPAAACVGGKWWLNYAGPDAIFDTNEGYLSVQCAEGYSNPQGTRQCNRCADGFYRNVSNECVACTTNAGQLVAMAIGLVILAAAMYSVSKSGFNVGAIAISINFLQVTSIFASFQIAWPLNVLLLFRFFEFFQIGIDIAQPECVVPSIGYSEKWIFMMALPLIFLCMLCTILIVIHGHHAVLTRTRFSLWFKRKFPRLMRKPEKPRAPNDESRAEMLKRELVNLSALVLFKGGASMVQTSTRQTREVVADSIINAFFMFLTLFYLAAVQKALEPFACFSTQFDDNGVPAARVMRADASIACEWDDPIWRLLATGGVIAGVLYGIGIPASILTFLYTGRFRLNVLAFGRKFGYLYRRYEREWYFWEVLVLSRKLSLAATRLFLSAHVFAQSTFGVVIITAFLSAQVFARPYEEAHLDLMETVLLSANYITLSMGFTRQVLSQQPWYNKDQRYALALETGIFTVLVLCLAFIVFLLVYDSTRQLIRLYRRRSLGEGKYGAGQLLHLHNLDKHTEELQVLGQTYMLASRRVPYISWLLQASVEDKLLFESVFKSFKHFLEESEKRTRNEAAGAKKRALATDELRKRKQRRHKPSGGGAHGPLTLWRSR